MCLYVLYGPVDVTFDRKQGKWMVNNVVFISVLKNEDRNQKIMISTFWCFILTVWFFYWAFFSFKARLCAVSYPYRSFSSFLNSDDNIFFLSFYKGWATFEIEQLLKLYIQNQHNDNKRQRKCFSTWNIFN